MTPARTAAARPGAALLTAAALLIGVGGLLLVAWLDLGGGHVC